MELVQTSTDKDSKANELKMKMANLESQMNQKVHLIPSLMVVYILTWKHFQDEKIAQLEGEANALNDKLKNMDKETGIL